MTRVGFLLLHAANLLVVVSGVAYAWMLYVLEPIDEFALWNHPWQGGMRDLHVISAPLLVLMVGAALTIHALPRLRGKEGAGRATGIAMLTSFLPMALSGSLLQTAVESGWFQFWLGVHLVASAIWCVAAGSHIVLVRRWKRRRRYAASAV